MCHRKILKSVEVGEIEEMNEEIDEEQSNPGDIFQLTAEVLGLNSKRTG